MRWRRWLAGAAALAGALAPIAGTPYRGDTARHREPLTGSRVGWPVEIPTSSFAAPPSRSAASSAEAPASPIETAASQPGASIDVAELARVVADQEDHVSAVELAGWIRARKPGLRVIDVRSASEYRAFHIPGAEHLALEDLAHAQFAAADTIVLYSEVGVHGAQAWVFLRALGHRRVFFLRNGLHEWLDDVMSPTIAADAPADAIAAFETVAELSRSFGGTPRRIDRSTAARPEAPARRRGC